MADVTKERTMALRMLIIRALDLLRKVWRGFLTE